MIRIQLTGRLGKDAELRTLESGDIAISFNVAHSRKDSKGTEHTTWVSCTKWVKAGGSIKIADYLRKGQQVLVEGEPSARAYANASGTPLASLECRVTDIELLGSAKDAAQAAGAPPANTSAGNHGFNQPVAKTTPAVQPYNAAEVVDDLPF